MRRAAFLARSIPLTTTSVASGAVTVSQCSRWIPCRVSWGNPIGRTPLRTPTGTAFRVRVAAIFLDGGMRSMVNNRELEGRWALVLLSALAVGCFDPDPPEDDT